jgi:hypothetical protein
VSLDVFTTTEVHVARQTDAELEESVRPASADELWAAVRIDPVEIALPKAGSGYTLRAYRPVDEVTPTDVSGREEDLFPQRRPEPVPADDETDLFDDQDEGFDEDDATFDDDESDADEEAEDEEEDEEAEEEAEAEPEEVPVFLGHAGQLYLFRSVEGLVEFVHSDAEHDLRQLDTWPELVKRISTEDVVPLPEDTYELDLVVGNLRGGRDAWDPGLIIQAGEIARDLGYALRLEPVIEALSSGSPLDDLDETLRATEAGGFGGFLARRRLKKIGAEAAPLGWRTIIGKISSVADWRD